MRKMMFSMMRLCGAVAMFGIEQAQNAIMAPADTRAALRRLRNTLDSMSESLASKLDSSKRAALDSISKAQIDMLDNTSGAVNLDAVNLDTAADFMKKTSESFAGIMRRSANGRAAGEAA